MSPPDHAEDKRAERIALLVGVGVVVAALAGAALLSLARPDLARGIVVQVTFHTFIGRETGIPVGFAQGLPFALVVALAIVQDLAILLIGYPIAAAIGRGALRIHWLERLVKRPHPARDRFAKRTEWLGVAILGLSLWVPFLPSGALVAALLARAAGYHPRLFLPVLATMALVADVMYGIIAHKLGTVIGFGNLALIAAGIVVAIGAALLARRWLKRHP